MRKLQSFLSRALVSVLLLSLLSPSVWAADTARTSENGLGAVSAGEEGTADLNSILGQGEETQEGNGARRTLTISSREDFESLARNCQDTNYSVNLLVMLECDLDFSGEPVMPIPSFSGIFDGQGHIILGFTCAANGSNLGLFRYLETGGMVRNLSVYGTVTPEGSRANVGGIVGSNYGTVQNCTFEGEVVALISAGGIVGDNYGAIRNCQASGEIVARHFSGGIAGSNAGIIRNCSNQGSINPTVLNEPTDLESLDLSSLLGIQQVLVEDKDTVSDIGGIAGFSSGTIVNCTNHGTIGYQHYGYNIGGIAGRQSGYLSECDNYGEIYGRKDVGGIVGQMEPFLILDSTSSLAEEIDALQAAMDGAMGNMSAASAAISSNGAQIRSSGEYIGNYYYDENRDKTEAEKQESRDNFRQGAEHVGENVGDAASQLDPGAISGLIDGTATDQDYENIGQAAGSLGQDGVTDAGTLIDRRRAERAAEQAREEQLNAEYNALSSSMSALGNGLHNTLSGLASDMVGVDAHFSNILSMFSSALTGNMQLQLMEDISDLDTETSREGKVYNSSNYGAVAADSNVGGIAGCMGVEVDFDMDGILSSKITDAVTVSKSSYFAKCVVQQCTNRGVVSGKKDYNGGVCGLGELGVITKAENYGDVISEGKYSGGIVGQSKSIVNSCYAMCSVDGSEYVGGIAGQGRRILDSHAMVRADETTACSGAICGWVDTADEALLISGNSFVSDKLGGIDGINYPGAASAVSYQDLLSLETLPEGFHTVAITCMEDGKVVQVLTIPYGGDVQPELLPEIPERQGYVGYWPIAELQNITASAVIEAQYINKPTGLSTNYSRPGDGREMLMLDGVFSPSAKAQLTAISTPPSLSDGYRLLEGWDVRLNEKGGEKGYQIHYLAPETALSDGTIELYVLRDGQFVRQNYVRDGSYLVFPVSEQHVQFIAVVLNWTLLAVVCGGVLAASIAVHVILRLRAKRRAERAIPAPSSAGSTL